VGYSKQTWVDGAAGGTPTSAARFNYMETGIAAAGTPTRLNVLDAPYSAVGDGITNDTAAIQAALDAAATAGGGIVVVPAGKTFSVSMRADTPGTGISTALVIQSNVTLQIDGTIKLAANQASVGASGGAIIRNANPFLGTTFPMPNPDHDMLICGTGVIDGNAANQNTVPFYGGTHPVAGTATNVYFGIRFDSAVRCAVDGLTVKNCKGLAAGSTITGSTPASLAETLHVSFYRCGMYSATNLDIFGDDGGLTATGVGSNYCTSGLIHNVKVHHLTYGAGNTHFDSSNVIVSDCISQLNGGHGFLTEYSHDIQFHDCIAGGLASNDDRSTNKIAVYSSDPGVGISVGPATGGTFTLTIGGQTTTALAYNASAATVQTAVRALTSVGGTNATVTAGVPTGPTATYTNWDITLTGTAAGQAITGTSSLTAGIFRIIPHVILGNAQDALNNYAHGFAVDTGNRVTIRGGMSAYNGNMANTLSGAGIASVGTLLTTTLNVVDGTRVFGNRRGMDFTFGDGATGANARSRVWRIRDLELIGPNKGQTDALAQSELMYAAGALSVTSGLMNAFLFPAVAASTVAVQNPFPFDVSVNVVGGTVTGVSVTPGGPAPSAAIAYGAVTWVMVPAGGSIAITYSVAPTWKWYVGTGVPH
jgi:hypothetical protein